MSKIAQGLDLKTILISAGAGVLAGVGLYYLFTAESQPVVLTDELVYNVLKELNKQYYPCWVHMAEAASGIIKNL